MISAYLYLRLIIVLSAKMVISGLGLTMTVSDTDELQPYAFVAVTVYVPVVLTERYALVLPSSH